MGGLDFEFRIADFGSNDEAIRARLSRGNNKGWLNGRRRETELKGTSLNGVHRRPAHFSGHVLGHLRGNLIAPVLDERHRGHGAPKPRAQLTCQAPSVIRDVRLRLRRSGDGAIGRKGRRDDDHGNDVSASPHGVAQYPARLPQRQATPGNGVE
jgi:hypothetical protein